ncbi:bifunctional diaminohydroxyphosphoribosylaminopyrimidine deaminase/5-amino-6-(5-phosphoribosylamino)uracil reductase RibD [Thiohalomonas denitrificans]|uniref:Riboflavin biosynthesis protein RibD n=1 Tax=Thiohalomonas denitrificans TaxID=415747 RepID=A0A1G5PZK0_9GAMM|nr:bifunctional diaminohydroxyphosphoribosylaminopyrimidine deaminase/5-amino-6-(5-phosphoribosylamino)uracil reductase RibD [Thiohalomonas denitrificans]SCZ55024.1 diaminohydroxyphosphoribosylaminopyrimidine deaminase [Thiohalomonas denitrificans]
MSVFTTDDHRHMARAIELAGRGLCTTDPNPRVGCVLVRDGRVVGEGWHEIAGGPHAEVVALRSAGEAARGATAYVTLEPCSHHGKTGPCSDALIEAGVSRVVSAMQDPNPRVAGEGLERLHGQGVDVAVGLMQPQAEALNPGFVMRMRNGRPFVRGKLAMSLDGRTAMASGESLWITGEAARRDVQRLRARSSAVVSGIGTVLSDDPSLNVRLEGQERQPLRVVLDPRLSMPETAKMLTLPGKTLVVTAASPDDAWERLEARGAEVVALPDGPDRIDLPAMLRLLAEREINEVLLETGAILSGAMLRAGFIDELVVYMAPRLMGDSARGLFRLPGLDAMADTLDLEIDDIRAVGRDWRITARPVVKATV